MANDTVAPGTPEQASGRISQPGFSLAGPVYIPHVINGRNKLFLFITYTKLTSIAPPAATPICSAATPAERNGDFSALLVGTVNPTHYIVYDPRSATVVNGHVTRTPFPGNILPASVMTNPITIVSSTRSSIPYRTIRRAW